jgi:hypothetical protein
MLERLEGRITSYRSITKHSVQFELSGCPKVIELTVSEPWVINKGDQVSVAGETDGETGKFIGYAYQNKSKGVFGKYYVANAWVGIIFVIAGLIFFWAIFPLIFVLEGLRIIAFGKKVKQAAAML